MSSQSLSCSYKIFEKKGDEINCEAIRRYLVSQNYKYEKSKVLTIHFSDQLKWSVLMLSKNLDWKPAHIIFTDEATFYGGKIRNRRWIASDQSFEISAMKSKKKINLWGAIWYSGENRSSLLSR